jgi:hypothetical protein
MSLGDAEFEKLRGRVSNAAERSRVLGTVRRVESTLNRWVQGSRTVQWFLAEPEPEVIVIDLRETYTVGPVIRALEWASSRGSEIAERTGIADATRSTVAWIESAPMRAVGWFLFACALGGLLTALVTVGSIAGWLVVAGLALLATRERRSAEALAETRAGRALIAAFEPPEPPERRD